MQMDRVRCLTTNEYKSGNVVYWMSRDQRMEDNWAFIYAQHLAVQFNRPLIVIFILVPEFLNAGLRQYHFMLNGLSELSGKLEEKGIPFYIQQGYPQESLPKLINDIDGGLIVTDFDPLAIKQKWKHAVLQALHIPVFEVDAHNIIPCWLLSNKQEYAAFTIRKKIKRLLNLYLDSFPPIHHQKNVKLGKNVNPGKLLDSIPLDHSVTPVTWLKPGELAAGNLLKLFVSAKVREYNLRKNDPNADGQSHLSPYLHFGQISAQRVVLEIMKLGVTLDHPFLDEIIVRRELSDNFCYYNDNYDSVTGFPNWARKTLNEHKSDTRTHIYNQHQFEDALTHDSLWNAAQQEMKIKGKMHGYMRMYWAKKILEWTHNPEDAMKIAIYLNDKYELDGRDPNGYAGIAWSIGGVHDRAWPERSVFGKIRYMNRNGCKSKFDVNRYIDEVNGLKN
ncbi:deoxyribodipyrimidine photo-lyase [bacterium]|nr:deoxyribodipyrimidine photo-lyase [candidate division CSSED10-310 bacterium]